MQVQETTAGSACWRRHDARNADCEANWGPLHADLGGLCGRSFFSADEDDAGGAGTEATADSGHGDIDGSANGEEMHERQPGEPCKTLLLTSFECLSWEVQLSKMLDEVDQDVHEFESLSWEVLRKEWRAMLAKPQDSVAEPAPTATAQGAGPRRPSVHSAADQRRPPPKVGAPPDAAPGTPPGAAGAGGPPHGPGGDGGKTAGEGREPRAGPRRKRQLPWLSRSARTLVVRNVPWSYNQEDLLAEWPPDGTYDYFHLPYHFNQDRPLGFAYINFVTYEAAAAFMQKWHGRFLSHRSGRSTLHIAVAKVQGRGPNLARIGGHKLHTLPEPRYLPVLLDGCRRLDAREVLAEMGGFGATSESGPYVAAYQ